MRIKEFEALPAGVYLMTRADLGHPPSAVLITENYELCLRDVVLRPHTQTWELVVDVIQRLQPLAHRDLSGAMCWGDPV